ncbi:MAG: efflux RND transporter permease subunit, partial [Lachnospiraceae bacterium]|nr:efflux RND transporter permease subunit [Lachnospiraceae bacterium]
MVSKFSVKKPYTVLVGVVLAIVLGVVSFTRMTTDLLPNISLPYVIVMTTYPGASPETVETVVTQPVEASMATVSNIAGINSVSGENYSMVILEFAQTADMNATSLEIRENLDQITSYWDDAIGNPIIMKLNPDMLPVMIAAVGVEGMDYAQVSTYVKESVIPELESIEGVASVSASGLLEESVNVIIRQEKVDALNEKIFAAIDKEMEDARKELAEGKQEILDGQKELADGKKEIKDGQKELDEGKAELVSGKTELENKKNETYQQLANTKRDLLTAKDNLEASKIGLTTDLSTAKGLDAGVKEIDMVLGAYDSYQTAMTQYQQALLSGDTAAAAVEKAKIEELKKNYIASKILTGALEAAPALAPMFEPLKTADWTDANQMQVILTVLMGVETQMSVPLTEQKTNLADALNALTNGLGLTAYETTVNQAVNTIDYNLNNVNNGLVEVEKGMLAAATEFANASTGITLGEYQMEQAQQQLDSALEQLKSGEEQLQDALKQIEDGEQQLADAQQSAYESADMNQVLTVSMISNLLVAQNFSMPAGYVTEDGIDYLVRVGDKPESVEELQQMPLMDLHMEGVPVVTLGDVADVFYTDNSASIYTNVDGSAGVMLTLQKQTGYSTGSVSDILAERFAQMMEKNDKLSIITLMDQGIYIDLVMDSIISNIGFGFFLAVLILIIFLKDLRPTLVIACSIPISLVTAIVCMYFSGVTLNVISLSGLALGIGMLVDNSIVVIENIYRLRSEGYSMREAAIEGSKEVAGAIVASTLTTICVFLPIVFTEGITRQLFVDMGLTIGYSLLASLVIALTVVPAMSSKILTKTKEKKQGRFYEAFVNGYEKVLKVSLKIKPVVFVLVLLLLVGSILAAYTNGTAFMTDMDSTQLTVTVQMPKEATLAETGEVTDRVVERIMEIPDVSNVGAMASSNSTSLIGGSSATNATTIYVVTYEDKIMSNEEIGKLIVEKTVDLKAEITVNTSSMDMS